MTDLTPTTAAGRAFIGEYMRNGSVEYSYVEVPTKDILDLLLLVEAEARAEGLDGERLARAYWSLTGKRMVANGYPWPDWDSSESDQYRAEALADGEELAREYAALEEPTP